MIKGVLYQSVQSPVFYRLLLLVVDFLSVNCRYIFQYHCIEKKVLKCQSLCGSSRLVRLGCACDNCIAHLYLLISRWTHPLHCLCLMNKCVSLSAITLLLMFERNGLMTQPRSNIDHVVCVGSSIKKSRVNLSFLRYKIKHRRLGHNSIVYRVAVKSMKVRFT